MEKVNTNGWNWFDYQLNDKEMQLDVNEQFVFNIPYEMIGLVEPTSKNEISIEFSHDKDKQRYAFPSSSPSEPKTISSAR